MTIPLWLDCDPGHDDAFAILLAANNPALRLLGISTVHGNASLSQTTTNALRMLTAINRTDIPVYSGVAKPFSRSAVHAPDIHGKSGLDGTTHLPKASEEARTGNAIVAMRDAILREETGTVWIVATGALTNVALLFAVFPELTQRVKGVTIMGGCVGGRFTDGIIMASEEDRCGNTTEWAEFNIYCDPEAAQSIFSNEMLAEKTTLIPLDLTHLVIADGKVQDMIHTANRHSQFHEERPTLASNIRPMFHDLLIFFAQTYKEVFGLAEGPPLHDPVAVAAVLPESVIYFDDRDGERWNVRIITDGSHGKDKKLAGKLGRTILTRTSGKGVGVPRRLDVGRFWQLIDEALVKAEQMCSQI